MTSIYITFAKLNKLVLVNGIYFKGAWAKRFDRETTRSAAFYLSDSNKVDVPMMKQTSVFRFGHIGKFAVLDLPYGCGEAGMYILLPGMQDLSADLSSLGSSDEISDGLRGLEKTECILRMPRFKVSLCADLAKTLALLGMPRAFRDDEPPDFSGICLRPPLRISSVLHKALADIDEEGTVAAGATAVVMWETTAAQPRPYRFTVDHPFAFMIRDTATGALLFLGRVMEPTK